MELDSDEEEIDEKLDRAYENSKGQGRSVNSEKNEFQLSPDESSALFKAAVAHTAPQMDTLSLLKAIADTGALISPALQTQLEFIQQSNHSVLPQSNMLQQPATDLDQSKDDRVNKFVAHKDVALSNLQPMTESQIQMHQNATYGHVIHPHEHLYTNPYADSLISPPNAYLSQEQISENRPPSGQSTPLLDEAPDTEEHKQTPNQYNQFASYTQGLYKPIASTPSDLNTKEMPFNRELFIPNETKKMRVEAPPISLNLKVFDYKHGTSVRPAVSASLPPPPPPFNETPMPRMSQQGPIESPRAMPQHHTHFVPQIQQQQHQQQQQQREQQHQQQQQQQQQQQHQQQQQQQQQQQRNQQQPQHLNSPYRPPMNPQHNMNIPPHLLPQPPPPFNLPNNQMPPYGMQDPNMNHTANSPSKEQSREDMKHFHEQTQHFQTPPPHPPLFRPPPNLMPPGNRHPPFNFRMPPPNELPHRYPRPSHLSPFPRPRHNFQHDYHRPNH